MTLDRDLRTGASSNRRQAPTAATARLSKDKFLPPGECVSVRISITRLYYIELSQSWAEWEFDASQNLQSLLRRDMSFAGQAWKVCR